MDILFMYIGWHCTWSADEVCRFIIVYGCPKAAHFVRAQVGQGDPQSDLVTTKQRLFSY